VTHLVDDNYPGDDNYPSDDNYPGTRSSGEEAWQ